MKIRRRRSRKGITFMGNVPLVLLGYESEDVINADKIGLFFCALSAKTLPKKAWKTQDIIWVVSVR